MLFQQQIQTKHASSIGRAASQLVMVVWSLQIPAQPTREPKILVIVLLETVPHVLIKYQHYLQLHV